MIKGFLERTLRSSVTPIIGILFFLILWGGVLLSLYGDPVAPVSITPFGYEYTLSMNGQAAISSILFLLDMYLLYRIISEFGLFNIRTAFAPGLFIALIGGSWFLIPLHSGNICLAVMLLAIYILLTTYQQRHAITEYVTSYALLGIITILSPKWMLLIPVFIIGCGLIQSLTLRTFMAAIIGLILPYWIGGGLLFLFDEMDHFFIPFIQLAEFCPIQHDELSLHQITALVLLLFLVIPSMFHYPGSSFSIREKARICYNILFVMFVSTLVLVLLQPCLVNEFYPLLTAVASIFVTQMLISARGRFRSIYFLILLLLYLIFITQPIWTDLLIS